MCWISACGTSVFQCISTRMQRGSEPGIANSWPQTEWLILAYMAGDNDL